MEHGLISSDGIREFELGAGGEGLIVALLARDPVFSAYLTGFMNETGIVTAKLKVSAKLVVE